MFPVLWQSLTRDEEKLMKDLGCPHQIPWRLIEPGRDQALRNHDQTLEKLAQRGGLCPEEIYAVLHGKGLRFIRSEECSLEGSVKFIVELLKK